jgi:peptide/nickel transport system ATP-binding protein
MAPLLNVRDLKVEFVRPEQRATYALRGADLSVNAGEMVGVLGESGSGKSTLARALLRLLPKAARLAGSAEFAGRNLLQMAERELAHIRGARLCLIPQDPGQALNPVLRVGDQVAEVVHAHRDWPMRRSRQEAEDLLRRVGLTSTERSLHKVFPHQLSGGQKQRVVIAQALACNPALVIADEPTASLDEALESEIIHLLNELRLQQQIAMLLITHKPKLLMGLADRVAVMYAGRIIEQGPAHRIFESPSHPYTKALLSCMKSVAAEKTNGLRLQTIPGSAPDSDFATSGCSFAPRCGERLPACDSQHPAALELQETQRVECLLYER